MTNEKNSTIKHTPNLPEQAQRHAPQTSGNAILTIRRPDDWHLHLRDGVSLKFTVPASAMQFNRVVVMPNLKPPVTDIRLALAYRDRIMTARSMYASDRPDFEPLMALYLTDRTDPALPRQVAEQRELGLIGFKLYPSGATTHSDAGVTDLAHCDAVLAAMEKHQVPLLIHGEVTHAHVDIFDREARFIEDVLIPLRMKFPGLRLVFEHITTQQAADYVSSQSDVDEHGRPSVAATITPQHLLFNRNAIFLGGIRPHWFCLPVLKREPHRQALLRAATSGNPQFFLGTDSAPHARGAKEASCGCAGCFTAPYAMELYAAAFDEVGQLAMLEGFASRFGPAFYGYPVNEDLITLQRTSEDNPYVVPGELAFEDEQGRVGIVPLNAGTGLAWRYVR